MENIIHIENLIYEYPQEEEKEVLRAIRGISLDIERGSFMSGQVAAMVNDERTTKEILEFLMYDLKLETELLQSF